VTAFGTLLTSSLSLVTGLTFVVDLVTCLFCLCQLMQTDMCCNALVVVGIGCMKNFPDIPLAMFMLPVSAYNAFRSEAS